MTLPATEKAGDLSANDIVEGFRRGDGNIVRKYFYDYCKIAYGVFNRRYGLASKPGMDFFSLAHEYYLKLYAHDFRQLEDRNRSVSFLTWMVNGFRYLVLDKLKETEKERGNVSFEERMERTDLCFDVTGDCFAEEFRNTVEELCRAYYGRDGKNAVILRMLFVDGFKGKEIAAQLGMTPSAVTQRYTKMMRDVVIPYFRRNFKADEYMPSVQDDYGAPCREAAMQETCAPAMITENRAVTTMDNNRHWRVTPEWIDTLEENEIFVFGSNLAGMHGGGAARLAFLKFGAVMGKGVGLQGQSYAIPTMQGGVDTIRPYVDEFTAFAETRPMLRFLVTPIGCGIAGFEPEDIAPLFRRAADLANVSLPRSFWDCL